MVARITAACLIFVALLVRPAVAAEIVRLQGGPCSLQLSGAVEEGDFDTLRRLIEATPLRIPFVLCLNSPGGSYVEGLQIIEYLLDGKASVGTMVEKNAACESICALIFLSGHRKTSGNTKLPDRRLHVLAKLGFHGPYLNTNSATYDATLATKAYEAGLRAVGRLLERPEQALFPLSLLGAGLAKGADEFLYVNTVGLAGAWQINLIGYRKPRVLTTASLQQACSNVDDWHVFGESPMEAQRTQDSRTDTRPIAFANRYFRRKFSGYGGEGTYTCFVDAIETADRGFFFSVQIGEPGTPSIRDAAQILRIEIANGAADPRGPGIPPFYVYHQSTEITQIAE